MKKEFKIRKFVRNPKKEDLKNQLIKAPTTTQLTKNGKKKSRKRNSQNRQSLIYL